MDEARGIPLRPPIKAIATGRVPRDRRKGRHAGLHPSRSAGRASDGGDQWPYYRRSEIGRPSCQSMRGKL